jgi:hypothetical protein
MEKPCVYKGRNVIHIVLGEFPPDRHYLIMACGNLAMPFQIEYVPDRPLSEKESYAQFCKRCEKRYKGVERRAAVANV